MAFVTETLKSYRVPWADGEVELRIPADRITAELRFTDLTVRVRMRDIAVEGATSENEGRLSGAHPPVVREIEQFVRAMIEKKEPVPDENTRPGGRPRILPVCTFTAISG